jgi:hypothetical protein
MKKKDLAVKKDRPWLSRQLLVLRSTDGLPVHSTTFSDLSLPLGPAVYGFRLVTAQCTSSPFEIP